MTTRRQFLERAFLAGSSLLAVNQLFQPAVAQPDYAPGTGVGLSMYTVREVIKTNPAAVLEQIARIGYKKIEPGIGEYYGYAPAEFKKRMDGLGLHVPSGHTLRPEMEKNLPGLLENLKTVGAEYLVFVWMDCKTLDDYKEAADFFNKTAETCKQAGIQFTYHNHDFEFKPIDGQVPYDLLLAQTDPQLVQFEMDLYWVRKGGADPLRYFQKHPGRFPLWHVKDMDNTPKQDFTEVGTGVIDFKQLFAQAGKAGLKHYYVEQDTVKMDVMKSIAMSYKYLDKLKG